MTEKRRHIRREEDRAMLEHFSEMESLKCPYCDIKEAQSKERWANLHEEQRERQAACSAVLSNLKETIEKMSDQKADKFTVQIVVSILLAALILFGGINTLLFQSIKSDLRTHTEVISKTQDR